MRKIKLKFKFRRLQKQFPKEDNLYRKDYC